MLEKEHIKYPWKITLNNANKEGTLQPYIARCKTLEEAVFFEKALFHDQLLAALEKMILNSFPQDIEMDEYKAAYTEAEDLIVKIKEHK